MNHDSVSGRDYLLQGFIAINTYVDFMAISQNIFNRIMFKNVTNLNIWVSNKILLQLGYDEFDLPFVVFNLLVLCSIVCIKVFDSFRLLQRAQRVLLKQRQHALTQGACPECSIVEFRILTSLAMASRCLLRALGLYHRRVLRFGKLASRKGLRQVQVFDSRRLLFHICNGAHYRNVSHVRLQELFALKVMISDFNLSVLRAFIMNRPILIRHYRPCLYRSVPQGVHPLLKPLILAHQFLIFIL